MSVVTSSIFESKKIGFELIDVCKCYWCSYLFEKRHSCDVEKDKSQKSSEVITLMSIGTLNAGASIAKIDQLLTSVGSITPASTKSHENCQKLKPYIMDLSKIE